MLRQAEVAKEYEIDAQGIVRSPGKFEGEPWYAVSLWDAMLDGCSNDTTYPDCECGEDDECQCAPVDWLDISVADTDGTDCDLPPELAGKRIGVFSNDMGFVYLTEPTVTE